MFKIGLLESNLEYKKFFNNIVYYPRTKSTNSDLWALYQKSPKKHLIISDNQTAGRGRGLNQWVSTPNKSLTCSFVLSQIFPLEKFNFHSLILPISIVIGVKKHLSLSLQIKWPNDIMYKNHKVGGILIETKKYSKKYILNIGIGMNVNELGNDLCENINKKAISLRMILGRKIQRELLLASILNELYDAVRRYTPPQIILEWQKHCNHINHKVFFKYNKKNVAGLFKKINNNGQAIIEFNHHLVPYDGAIKYL